MDFGDVIVFISTLLIITGFTSAQKDYDVRLVNKQTTARYDEGRIEVYHNGEWGTICDDLWHDEDAAVVCGMMSDYTSRNAKAIQSDLVNGKWQAPFGEGTGVIWLHDVSCAQGMTHLSQCTHAAWNSSTECQHNEDAGVRCWKKNPSSVTMATPITNQSPGTTKATVIDPNKCIGQTPEVRLISVAGSPGGIGLLEVLNKGTNVWGQVCDNHFTVADAKVICRMLCYNPNDALPGANSAYVGQPTSGTSIHLSRLGCSGQEVDIYTCPQLSWSSGGCRQHEAVSVTCKQPDVKNLDPDPELKCNDKSMTATFFRVRDRLLTPADVTPDACGARAEYVNQDRDVAITIPYDDCNTKTTSNETSIIYSTQIFYSSRLNNNDMRRKTFIFNLHCVFPRNDTVDKGAVVPKPRIIDKTSTGRYKFVMEIFTDATFSRKVTEFPWNVTLGDWLNVGVILRNEYTKVKLVVDTCRVMPVKSQANPSFPIISNKCPSDQVTLFPQNRTTFTFNFKTFKFSGSYDKLYVECDAIVCQVSQSSTECDQSCRRGNSSGRRKRHAMEHAVYTVRSDGAVRVVSQGEVRHATRGGENDIARVSVVESDVSHHRTMTHDGKFTSGDPTFQTSSQPHVAGISVIPFLLFYKISLYFLQK